MAGDLLFLAPTGGNIGFHIGRIGDDEVEVPRTVGVIRADIRFCDGDAALLPVVEDIPPREGGVGGLYLHALDLSHFLAGREQERDNSRPPAEFERTALFAPSHIGGEEQGIGAEYQSLASPSQGQMVVDIVNAFFITHGVSKN